MGRARVPAAPGAMDDAHTRQTLEALADLFLTEDGEDAPAARSENQTRSADGPPVPDQAVAAPIRLAPKPARRSAVEPIRPSAAHLTLAPAPDDDPIDDEDDDDDAQLQSPAESVHVEAVVLGNLPVLGRPWLTQYAHQLACTRGPVAVIHVDATRIDVDLVGTTQQQPTLEGMAPPRANDDALDAASLADRLERLACHPDLPVRTWLMHVPAARVAKPHERPVPLKNWTLLSGTDETAVVAARELLTHLLEHDRPRPWRCVRLAAMGNEEQAASVADELDRELRASLSAPLRLVCALRRMVPVHQRSLGSFANDGEQWLKLLTCMQTLAPDMVSAVPTDRRDPTPEKSNGAAAADRSGQTSATPSPAPAGPPSNGNDMSRPVEVDAGLAADLVEVMEAALPGTVPLDARCPAQPHIRMVLDQEGRIHLLRRHDPCCEDSLQASLLELISVRNWVQQHLSLLQLTRRQCRFDPDVEPVLHLFADEAKATIELMQQFSREVRFHLLKHVEVGDRSTWVTVELN
jgi:hypothetical protein